MCYKTEHKSEQIGTIHNALIGGCRSTPQVYRKNGVALDLLFEEK